jgi:prolipoprotein diacylglyceryltransferase
MCQVLFRISLKPFTWLPHWWPETQISIPGFGVMLALTLLVCTWIGTRRALKERVSPHLIQDLAIWIFVFGLIGARVVYIVQFWDQFKDQSWYHFLMIWQGGIVFYGSALGGIAGYALAYFFQLRNQRISTWQIADIVAPAAAIGLCLGRVGCFLNGCCFGNVACLNCPAAAFPLPSPARYKLVGEGLQTAAGFTLVTGKSPATVAAVEPGSAADSAGLQPGDVIVAANALPIAGETDLARYLWQDWPRGQNVLALTLDSGKELKFTPRTLGLHPTQLYESISTLLLFLVLTAFYPFRRCSGQVMVLFILGYSVHRFLDEMLRNDTPKVAWDLTLSEWGSIFFFAVGLFLALYLWRQPSHAPSPAAAA